MPAPKQSPSLGQFGPLVIGEAAFAAEQKVVKSGETKFGPAVMDHPPSASVAGSAVHATEAPEVHPERPPRAQGPIQRRIAERRAAREAASSPATELEELDAKLATPGPGEHPDYVAMSLEKLEAYLDDNPAFVERIMDAELARPDGPRKGALLKLRSVEKAKEHPSDAVLEELEAAIEARG